MLILVGVIDWLIPWRLSCLSFSLMCGSSGLWSHDRVCLFRCRFIQRLGLNTHTHTEWLEPCHDSAQHIQVICPPWVSGTSLSADANLRSRWSWLHRKLYVSGKKNETTSHTRFVLPLYKKNKRAAGKVRQKERSDRCSPGPSLGEPRQHNHCKRWRCPGQTTSPLPGKSSPSQVKHCVCAAAPGRWWCWEPEAHCDYLWRQTTDFWQVLSEFAR